MLQDGIHRLRIERPPRYIPPAMNGQAHTAAIDVRRLEPGVQRPDRPAGEVDDFLVIGAAGFGAAEVNGSRRKGRAALVDNRILAFNCSLCRPATSLRRRPPEARATISSARSRRSRRRSYRWRAVWRGRRQSRPWRFFSSWTAGRIADLRAGEAKSPSSPRHFVSVDQLGSRRRTVHPTRAAQSP
ncbi:hypothetical protein GGD55_005448 [Rhizobium giardinii]|uniref:Uncharacterized protein n=1 Tax=Rhizobium giardinii TaxID=56731 RepID=A0A7W8UGC4_9HYPH|nr:hypothetical protein [Rhizobium giardinii]